MSGWMAKLIVKPSYWLLPGLLVCCMNTQADEKGEQDLPSGELLEFLADWEDGNGKWLGPDELDKLPEIDRDKPRDFRDAK